MLRTNIYFPENTHQQLQRLAKQENISMAELVREFVKEGVEKKQKKRSGPETLLAMARNAKDTGISDLAIHHDTYLYGDKRI